VKRDDISLSDVPASQQATHEALLEWARWCAVRPSSHVQPMFRGYTPYLYPEATGGRIPIDEVLARKVQRAYADIPDRHRAVLRWWYCFPFISPNKIRREMELTKLDLWLLVRDARAMVGNLMRGA